MSTIMPVQTRPKSRLNLFLWATQILLAAFYAMVGIMKLTQPIPALSAMMIWPGEMPAWFVRFVGTAELAGAVGLILPMATRILPRFTPVAALGLVALQLCAVVFHVTRGEFGVLPMNALLLALPAFIVWGRGGAADR